jgi:hypothetical protein
VKGLENAQIFQLTRLKYVEPKPNGTYQLYVFDERGLHNGGQYFRKFPRYPDEEITLAKAKIRVIAALEAGKEVRICDMDDHLIFHAKGQELLSNYSLSVFWKIIDCA